jgi:hypothetical protein
MSKLMKTNTNKYKANVFKYLLDSIEFEDLDGIEISDNQKIDYLFATYEDEFGKWNKKRYLNDQERLAQWLMGLPSCIGIVFSYYDILIIAAKLHEIDVVPKEKEDIICNNYFNHMALMLMKLRESLTNKK